jgi:23S rRNA pseudouridine2605 synthase
LTPVVPERARIEIDQLAVARAGWRTIAFHKPRGVVTTARDPEGRDTIYDVLGDAASGLIPVGRLDLASTGLLLLTNDTQLAAWLTDPANGVPRTYIVTVRGSVSDETVDAIEQGVDVDGERLAALGVTLRKRSRRETHLVVTLDEGRNREIRRLFAARGHEVTRLKRVTFGWIGLGDLRAGESRAVTREEISEAFPYAPIADPPSDQ